MPEFVVLVDTQDRQIGLMEKQEAHVNPTLHRAFSIFIFNSKGEMLLQQRALTKYHTPGLWTNTCCSHPRDGESLQDATKRRLMEEMGMECELKEAFSSLRLFRFSASAALSLILHSLIEISI